MNTDNSAINNLGEQAAQAKKEVNDLTAAVKINNAETEKVTASFQLATASLQQSKDSLAELSKKYEILTRTQSDNTKQAKDLNTQIGKVSATIAEQEKKVSKSREVFDLHKKASEALSSSFNKLKDTSGSFGEALGQAASGFETLKSGLYIAKVGFQGMGAAIKATGFGLLVLAINLVIEKIQQSKPIMDMITGVIAGIGAVVNVVKDAIWDMATNIGKIGDFFHHPMDSIQNSVIPWLPPQ
ncbi:phage tail tape measure protein [Mucilaginibacter gilvus]|uniref:Uncharacterized protein n=1 Tax=Mucilaginibacter gilvus TaxID=2305909 RepID=A0A444MN99_9SPHI|nr:hypothetical protein [Mucilaginibacter gilvus]RWY51192.1 hypothetical protein EPL05_14095 [Mucilaginibacter gilvus]